MRADLICRENLHLRMARTTGQRRLLLEGMRLMAADAARVPVRKERTRRHQRSLLRMTRDATFTRFGCFGVLMLMAVGAYLFDAVAAGVSRVHVLVASVTGPGSRTGILVGPMAAETIALAVYLDGRSLALCHCVAAHAVGWRKFVKTLRAVTGDGRERHLSGRRGRPL